MFDISFGEIGIIAVIAIVVVGPEKLPAVIRTIGKTVGKIRALTDGIKSEVERELKLTEIQSSLKGIKSDIGIDEIKNQLSTVSLETENAMKIAQDRFKASIEEGNKQYLATDHAIKNFSYQDMDTPKINREIDFSAQSLSHYTTDTTAINNTNDDQVIFDEDFSDFYAIENEIHGLNIAKKRIHHDSSSRLKDAVRQRQLHINTPPDSPAALVRKIQECYKNRYLMADHELREIYHIRVDELFHDNNSQKPNTP